jgi:hypothetical protein
MALCIYMLNFDYWRKDKVKALIIQVKREVCVLMYDYLIKVIALIMKLYIFLQKNKT